MSTPEKTDRAPLSQRSGRAKLVVGIPLLLVAIAATFITPISDIAKLLAAAAGAYVIVGVIETVAGSSLSRLAKSWDQLSPWKQRLISTIVIVSMIVGCIVLLPPLFRLVG